VAVNTGLTVIGLDRLKVGLVGLMGLIGLMGLEGGLCGFKTEEYFSRHLQTKSKQDCCLSGENFIWIDVE
jgi:hypothetical protein